MSGWIKLHRQFLEWEWFEDANTMKVFLYILLKANHKDGNWKGVELKRGQMIFGRKKASEKCRISEQSVRTSITRLKSTKEITIKTTNRYSLITVLNYENYQGDNQQINQQTNILSTNNQPAINHKQECKKEKKEKEKYSEEFDKFYKNYKGTKRKMETEFLDFQKHPDFTEVLPELLPSLKREEQYRATSAETGTFMPPRKELRNWLALRAWESIFASPESNQNEVPIF